MIEVPRTSLQEPPYDFRLESEALQIVDRILERTQADNKRPQDQLREGSAIDTTIEHSDDTATDTTVPKEIGTLPPPSCPTEIPLTPIKSSFCPLNSDNDNPQQTNSTPGNLINLGDFEDTHYNPFDHLELQTIDELRELDLVFQASYANQANSNQLQTTANDAKKT